MCGPMERRNQWNKHDKYTVEKFQQAVKAF